MNDFVSLDEYLVSSPGFTYLMKVSSDSMVDEGILPNDLVIIDKLRTPRNGDVVAACINDTWTLTYYRDLDNQIRLQPANPKYTSIAIADAETLGGVVVSVIKKYY